MEEEEGKGAGGRTLPGEDLECMVLDDVEHWIGVYEELTTTLTGLVKQQEIAGVSTQDLEQVRDHLWRAERRLGFWRRRLVQLQARA
ncbi:MAG: hypothetical protein J2P45_00210 [Candidatus Dormibacteraeota bacterium]|nr:hypothetical protein [Candidatus Dormibacteraeota bacterium]